VTPTPISKVVDTVRGLSPRAVKMTVVVMVVVLVAAVVVPMALMSRPAAMGGIKGWESSHKTLEKSLHAELSCNDCHIDERGPLVYALALTGEFYRGLFVDETPAFLKMHAPSNEACLTCHDRSWSDDARRTLRVPHPAHLRVANETRECVECHKWTAHQEEYLERHKTMPFSGVCVAFECHVGTKQIDQCVSCHHSLEEKDGDWNKAHPKTVLTTGGGACFEACHQVKQCQDCHISEKPLASTEATASTERKEIEALHVKSNWIQTHGTWALPDPSKCLTCHVSEGECQNCHSRRPASHGSTDTWIAAHKSSATDERRCVTCHDKAMCDDCHDQFKEMR
jgi:cytochrome c-type protein NapC